MAWAAAGQEWRMQRSVSEQGFLVKHVCMSAPFFFSIIAQQRPHMAGSELECGGGLYAREANATSG